MDEALHLLAREQVAAAPHGGRWQVIYRERNHGREDEVLVYDSADPEANPERANTVPCWLDLVLTLRAEGIVDGRDQPYTGPLIAGTSGAGTILGPYPEGFVCVVNGAFELNYAPSFPPHTASHVGIHVSYRLTPAYIEVDGEEFPDSPDFFARALFPNEGLWGWTLNFREHEHTTVGFRMSPVTSQMAGDNRVLSAEAFYSLVKGVPAAKLPVRVEWELEGFPTWEEGHFTHDSVTDAEGRVLDSFEVPAEVTKGSVRFWYHGAYPDYSPSSGQQFDLAKAEP